MTNVGDRIQITYFRDLVPTMEIVQSFYKSEDKDWLYLTCGKYRVSKIKAFRNLTKERTPEVIEDE